MSFKRNSIKGNIGRAENGEMTTKEHFMHLFSLSAIYMQKLPHHDIAMCIEKLQLDDL